MWVVRIWEPNPPAGTKPVEWYLLTTEAVPDIEAAWEVVGWYQCRWIVEISLPNYSSSQRLYLTRIAA